MDPNKRPLKALIVDDEAELASMLALRLSADGFEVRVAADGAAALELARRWLPHVVVTDLQMPGLDGWELCRALRADGLLSRVPVMVMTAWQTPEIVDRARSCGASAVVLKPFDERRLPSALRSLAARRAHRPS